MKKIIVADDRIPFLKGLLEPWFEMRYIPGGKIDAESVRDACALFVRTRTRCDAALLRGSAVEFIGTMTIGFDHINLDYCSRSGIRVATAAGCNARAVMQYLASALVHLSRIGGWSPREKTLGVIGVGNVGSLAAWLGRSCGFQVICCDPPLQEIRPESGLVSREELLAAADIVTLHVPLTRSGRHATYHLADREFFGKIRPGAILINTSRGKVVEDDALREAIDGGKISAAVLDVWEHEPEIDRGMLRRVTYSTPHIAGYTLQGKANGTALVIREFSRRHGLGLDDWYPSDAPSQVTDRQVDWALLNDTIDRYYDIRTDDRLLRTAPQDFEQLRNLYNYRTEYF